MLIKRVELIDIKSYRKAQINFYEGTNAISGENGAGKSTILEAIGYALFDYRPYKIENMVRHGQKKGEIRTIFTGTDGREYEVVRTIRTKGGTSKYIVHDLRAGGIVADSKHHGKEGVVSALRKDILGMPTGSDIQTLFEDVIGVPQGTIISPFLDTPAQRKEKFDPILGIEDYKRAYDSSGSISKVIERNIHEMEKEEATLSGRLEGFPLKKDELERTGQEIAKLQVMIEERDKELKDVKSRKSGLEARERDILNIEGTNRESIIQRDEAIKRKEELRTDLETSKKARVIVEGTKADHDAYVEAETSLQLTEKARKERDDLLKEQHEFMRKEVELKERTASFEREAEKIREAEKNIPGILEKLRIQKEMEDGKKKIEQAITVRKERQLQMQKLTKERSRSKQKLTELQEQLKGRDELEKRLEERSSLERKLEDLKKKEISFTSRIEDYQKSRDTLASGECTFFKEPCPKIPDDPTQLFVKEENELRTDLRKVWGDLAGVNGELKELQELETRVRNLSVLVGREKMLMETMGNLEKEISSLEHQIAEAPDEALLKELGRKLIEHGDFIGEHQHLSKVIQQKPMIQQELTRNLEDLHRIQKKLTEFQEKLTKFNTIDQDRERLREKIQGHKKGYDDYKAHLLESRKVEDLQGKILSLEQKLDTIEKRISEFTQTLSQMKASFDAEELKKLTILFEDLHRRMGSLKGQLKIQEERRERLSHEILEMDVLVRKREDIVSKLEVERFSRQLMKHIRDIFRRTPEYLRKRYVTAISQDANNRFHELMGDNSLDITWNKDYGITMRKGKDETDFKLLSGGQQMAAALAVRLALIRRFSNLKIAFFDEPTHNLDDERRENLARAFYGITGFDQLFVISHDETFNTVIENTIGIRMVNGESVVEC